MAMWMTYAALSGVLFALAAWITESAVRGRGGAARFAWLGGMVLTVALPCLAFLPERETTVAPMTTSSPADVEFWLPIMFEAGTLDAAQPIASSDAPARDYDRALLVAWALMSASLALAFVVALAGLRIRRRAWRSATVDGVDVLVAQDAGPAAVGAFRPRIVLPEWSLTATPAARRLMLEHEMEHVRARDPMVLAGAGALLVAMPWNVALWWQTARLRQAMELDCDARVLRRHPDPQSYAGVLLDVARGESRWMLASPAMARRRSLERRIRLLVPRRRPLRSAALGIVTASGLVLLACGVERPRPDLAAPMTLAAPATSVVSQSSSPAPAETPAVSYVEAADVTPPVVVDVEVAEPRLPVPTPMDAVSDTPPPAVRPNVEDVPSFTPMTQRPTLRNIDEMRAALRRFYPPVLRDAGVGGTATVWFLIDETGRVQRTQIQRSSGNATLDEAALQVARMMEFTPARNRDREVAVWIQLPIVFDARHGEGPAGLGAVDPAAMVDSIFTTELFQAAATRPAGYPARLPFVPGTAATVTDFRDGVRAGIFWHDPSPDVVERATALSRADGWVLVSDSTQYMNPEFGIRVVRLQRNGIEREIVAGLGDAPMAMLVQARPEE